MQNKSLRNMLKSKGPRIDAYGTPNRISSQELYVEFILVLYFLFFKKLYTSLSAGMLNP